MSLTRVDVPPKNIPKLKIDTILCNNDNCPTPELSPMDNKKNNMNITPSSLISLVTNCSTSRNMKRFSLQSTYTGSHSPVQEKQIYFRTTANSRKNSIDKIKENKYHNNENDVLEIINDINELITNNKYREYLLNQIKSKNDNELMQHYIDNIQQKCGRVFKLKKEAAEKTIINYTNKSIEKESNERIKSYNKCFDLCFKVLDDLRDINPTRQSKTPFNKSNINFNFNLNVNNIGKSYPKKNIVASKFKKGHKNLSSLDDNMIQLGSEEKCIINTLNLYNFEVTKPSNGKKIINQTFREEKNEEYYKDILSTNSKSDFSFIEDEVQLGKKAIYNSHRFPYHISKKQFCMSNKNIC